MKRKSLDRTGDQKEEEGEVPRSEDDAEEGRTIKEE